MRWVGFATFSCNFSHVSSKLPLENNYLSPILCSLTAVLFFCEILGKNTRNKTIRIVKNTNCQMSEIKC